MELDCTLLVSFFSWSNLMNGNHCPTLSISTGNVSGVDARQWFPAEVESGKGAVQKCWKLINLHIQPSVPGHWWCCLQAAWNGKGTPVFSSCWFCTDICVTGHACFGGLHALYPGDGPASNSPSCRELPPRCGPMQLQKYFRHWGLISSENIWGSAPCSRTYECLNEKPGLQLSSELKTPKLALDWLSI